MSARLPLQTLAGRILLAALFLGLLFDAFFYNKALGISLLLFVGAVLLILFRLGKSKGIHPARANMWLLGLLLLIAAWPAVRANPALNFMNLLAVLTLLLLTGHYFIGGRLADLGLAGYPFVLVQTAVQSLGQTAPLIPAGIDLTAARRRGRHNLFPLLRGVLLATPVLLVFTLFLVSADVVFAGYVESVLTLDIFPNLLELTFRGLLVGLVAWVMAGGMAYTLLRDGRFGKTTAEQTVDAVQARMPLGAVEALTVLFLVNLLFASFVAVQFAYLFGGLSNINLEGFTYAEYARRGFFELVAVAVMTLGLILGLNWLARRPHRRQRLFFNLLSTAMVVLVLVMLISAFQRLLLYEDAYGFTRLRLSVHVFMVWLAFLFIWFLVTLWRARPPVDEQPEAGDRLVVVPELPGRFALGALLAVVGFLVTFNALNPDAFIARQNIARYQDLQEEVVAGVDIGRTVNFRSRLDVYYLIGLSDDAIPVLAASVTQIPVEERPFLCEHLDNRQARLTTASRYRAWPAFNLGRLRAARALATQDWQQHCPETSLRERAN